MPSVLDANTALPSLLLPPSSPPPGHCAHCMACCGLIGRRRTSSAWRPGGGIRRTLPRVHRYYLKNNHSTDPLIPDEMIGELLKESQITLLQLNAPEVAWQLTLEDFKVFREIEPTEYVDELFELDSKYGCPMIRKFAEVRQFLVWVQLFLCVRLEVR